LISKLSLTGCTIAVLIITRPLTAQPPDPSLTCIRRASALTNVVMPHITGRRRGGLANGNDIIWWSAKLPNNQTVSGFCEVNPPTGRVVKLGTDRNSRDVTRTYKMSPDDAERVCEREARARFNPGDGLIVATFQPNSSTNSTYRVGWHYNSMARTIRKGRCEIDSSTGHIRKFVAGLDW
jgi:hypothetical protein